MPGQRRVRPPSRLQRVIHTLRTEGGTRAQEAWAIGLGLVVGFIAISMFLPLFDLTSMAHGSGG